jgi:K+-transporting ATPase A subunit
MKSNLSLSERVHKWFFVEEAKPRLVIDLCSSAVGAAVAISLDIYRKVDENSVLNEFNRIFVIILMFIVGISVTIGLMFFLSGIYIFRKRHIAQNSAEVDSTETMQKKTIPNSEKTNLTE